MHLSTPRIQSIPRTDIASIPLEAELEPRPLLNYLHHQLHEHFSRLQASQTTHCCFVTFIVGPSTHPSASTALHSHLVSAFTAPPNEAHSILYIPTDLITGLPTSTEWHPLLVYLAASLLFPHLSFLVLTPDYHAGASSSVDSLVNLLRPAGPLVLFCEAASLVNPNVLLHLPPYSTFHTPDVTMEDASASVTTPAATSTTHPSPTPRFTTHSPEEVLQIISTTTGAQLSKEAASRDSLSTDPVRADQFFPLYCTPYYGYEPTGLP